MPLRSPIALLIALVLSGPAAVAAPKPEQPECPYAHSEPDKIVAAMAAAPSCRAALALFRACALGASGDTPYGVAVTERCEKDFVASLGRTQKRAYDAEHRRCDRKYRNEQGTMYISFTAFCHAELAERYARRFGRNRGKR